MIRRIALFMLCACAAAFAQTTTFTANLKDLGINTPTAYVELTLKNCAGSGATPTIPHVNGVGVVTFPVQLYPVAGAISTTVYDETFIVCGSSAGVGYYHIAIYQGDSTRSLVKKLLFADDFDVQGASFNLNSATPRSGAVITPPPATAVLTNPVGNQTVVQPVGTALSINHLSATFAQNANGADMISGNRFTDTSPTGNFLVFKNAANNATLWDVDVTGTLTTGIVPAARVSSGTVAIANGGTGQATASAAFNALSPLTTLGDLIFGNGANSGTRLAGNTTTTKNFLTQTGTGTVSAAPAWGSIASADLTTALTTPPAIGASTPSTGAFTTVMAGKLNNRFVLDGSKYGQNNTGIHSALTDCVTQGGGTVVVPAGVSISVTTQLVIGNNTTKPSCEIEIEAGATLDFSGFSSAGNDAIQVGDGSGIKGHMGLPAASATFRPSMIKVGATSNFNALIAPLDRTGGQEGMILDSFLILGNASAICSSAIIDVQGIFINTRIDNINTSTIPCKILRIRAGTVQKIASDLMFYNDNFDASNTTGGIPVSIEGAAASEIGNVTFLGGGIQHAGNGNPLISINGAGVANGAHHVSFIRVHLENAGTPAASEVTLTDTNHIWFVNCRVSGPASTNLFTLSQSGAGITHDINIQQVQVTGTPTNLINNTIDTTTVSSATTGIGIDLLNYNFQGVSVQDNVTTLGQSKAYTATGDFTAGAIHLAPLSPANGQMSALTFGASSGAGTYGGADFRAAFGGIYAEGSGAFGLRLHFASSNAFGSGAIFGWQLSETGNWVAERKGTNIQLLGATSGTSTITAPATGGAAVVAPSSAGTLTVTIASGTAAMTTAGIGTGACGTTVTVVANGVLTTDTINVSRNAAATIGNGGGLTLNWWPTAGNVNFNYCNSSAGTITPTAMTVNWSVAR